MSRVVRMSLPQETDSAQAEFGSFTATADTTKSPRGVRGFQLNNGNFTTWKVQGKVGGYLKYASRLSYHCFAYTFLSRSYPDKVRGKSRALLKI